MPNPGLDNLTPEPRYGSLISSTDVALQADIAALQAADVSLDGRLDAVEAQLASTDPRAIVTHNATQSISSGSAAILAFNTEVEDSDTIHDTVTNNSRLTCKTAGFYTVTAYVQWAANATGQRFISLFVTGSTQPVADRRGAVGGGAITEQIVTAHLVLAVNDYVEVRVFQDSGGSLNVSANPRFSMVRIGG
jgi:hypothetical protein